ncbi:alpha/beta hydrolase family protein [Neolewinella persica]|uniref:alpha/beta hydrolase family protein n=1 Tax=Neolewinella persica TaxID=70998 RepID=UPI00037CE0CE|nr:alpha/beta hydrolase [Neolewinella persica]
MKSVLYVLLCCTTSLCAQLTLPEGNYLGYLQLSDGIHPIRLALHNDSTIVRLPELSPDTKILGEYDGSNLQFALQHTDWRLNFNEQQNRRYTGTVIRNGESGQVKLYLLAKDQSIDTAPFCQNYSVYDHGVLSIWQQQGTLRMHSPVSGRVSRLYKIFPTEFVSDAGEHLSFASLHEGAYQGGWYRFGLSTTHHIDQLPPLATTVINRQEVMILGDTVGMSLYLPGGDGPFPACIIPMGAANYERWIYTMEARILAAHGIATLIYDNYGSGKSGGTLQDKTFADKRDQAVALHNWLAVQPKIQADGIGFRGGSQGGRLSLMAAAKVPNTAFVIALSAPLETRLDQQLYAFSAHHRQRGFPEEAIARNADLWRRFFQAVANERSDVSIDPDLAALRSAHPQMILPQPTNGQVPSLPWAADLKDDGRTYLGKINCPVLALYGTEDDRVPARRSANLLREGLIKAGKQPPEIILYSGASHAFQLPGQRIVPGLFMDQVRFIRSVTQTK